ncbi:MAG: TonB-dependent receptor plug domain-containing protein, partial [Saprospiraceae bacterium]|nr:TonB-dependent receptor plug domain-containing protein [Saprospiraceae bacterium]
MKNIFFLILFSFLSFTAFSQTSISGNIVDENNLPVIGANILAEGTSVGTITGIDGDFTLDVPAGVENIVISYTGYQSQTIPLQGQTQFFITMAEGQVLDEVVVTALGVSRDEKALGYAVQTVSSESIKDANTVSAIDALAGSAAGVQVTQASGAAGAASRIVLRGQTSFNGNNQALIVVDGVRLDNSEFHSERSLGGVANSNRAMDINPNDIENVSILKGAAATALYGIEGARGVVLITTKRGSSAGLKVDVGTGMTFSNINNVVGLNDEYTQGWSGQWAGPSTAFIPSAVSWGAHKDDLYWDGSDYKWDKNGQLTTDATAGPKFVPYDNVNNFFETGTTWNTNIAISGGSEAADYRFSFGHSDEKGVAPNNTFTRYNLGLNLGSKALDDKLDLRFTANYAKTGGNRVQQGSNISGVMLGLLRTPISFDNANGNVDPANDVSSYQFEDNSQRNYRAGGGYDNPFWIVNNTPFNDNVNRFFGNISASYAFSDWVNLRTTLGTDFYTDNRTQRFELGSRNAPAGQVI